MLCPTTTIQPTPWLCPLAKVMLCRQGTHEQAPTVGCHLRSRHHFEAAVPVTVRCARSQKFDHIDCLINNAGVFAGRQRELTKEGYELTYGINVQALYLVTCLLLSKVGLVIPACVRTLHVHQSHA